MNRDEFRTLMNETKDEDLLDLCLRNPAVPYVFDPHPASWPTFRAQVSHQLGVGPDDIAVVGSGRLGFSLKPYNNFKLFTAESDIDVVVVNAAMFDTIWINLLTAAYPRQPADQQLGGWLRDRRNEVYTGWISPTALRMDLRIWGAKAKPVNTFSFTWWQTLQNASQYPKRRNRGLKARLYRTWDHADLYHLHSLSELRKSLNESGQ